MKTVKCGAEFMYITFMYIKFSNTKQVNLSLPFRCTQREQAQGKTEYAVKAAEEEEEAAKAAEATAKAAQAAKQVSLQHLKRPHRQ